MNSSGRKLFSVYFFAILGTVDMKQFSDLTVFKILPLNAEYVDSTIFIQLLIVLWSLLLKLTPLVIFDLLMTSAKFGCRSKGFCNFIKVLSNYKELTCKGLPQSNSSFCQLIVGLWKFLTSYWLVLCFTTFWHLPVVLFFRKLPTTSRLPKNS